MSEKTTEIKRPVLSRSNFDTKNERFRLLVKSYKNWCEDGEDVLDDAEEDIRDVILNNMHNLDGYELAKELESTLFVGPDARLVDLLDIASVVVESQKTALVKKWVQENNLSLGDVVGKRIESVARFSRDTKGYFITNAYPEKYQVCVDKDPLKKGGYIVNFEDVVFGEQASDNKSE